MQIQFDKLQKQNSCIERLTVLKQKSLAMKKCANIKSQLAKTLTKKTSLYHVNSCFVKVWHQNENGSSAEVSKDLKTLSED